MEALSRAIVLASQAFSAGIPFVILVSEFGPGRRDLASRLIDRFRLDGSTAEQVRGLFSTRDDVEGAVTVFAVVFLVVSAVSFAGSLQVVYERTLSAAHVPGWRSRTRAAAWLAVAGVYVGLFLELHPDFTAGVADGARAAITIMATFLFWLWTPRILLGPRGGGWRALVPIAGVTALAISLLTLASPLWMPGMISDEASRFGTIGVAFALLSWLVLLALVIVESAVVASQIRLDRAQRSAERDATRAASA